MFGFPRRPSATPELNGQRIRLRPPNKSDFGAWQALRGESRAFLTPWEPRWSDDELSPSAWRTRLRQWRDDADSGVAHTFFITSRPDGDLLGGIAVFNIRHGAAESAEIGYWMGERHAGRGIMGEALPMVAGFCFGVLGLRRIEAACIPDNRRSARVLERSGFQYEGLVRSDLRIEGIRRDQLLYSLLAPDGAGGSRKD